MTAASNIWAVIPIKETCQAKQRLAGIFDQNFRRQLALAMLEDTLRAISAVPELEGIIVTTVDMAAADIALQFDAHVWCESASKSHTDAVMAAARRIGADNGTILTMPGDIPLVTTQEIRQLVHAHGEDRAFTIVPAHNKQGSNAILCSPADAVPFQFGPNSFFPHLAAAQKLGIDPRIVEIPSIALDIDEPSDVAEFMHIPSTTSTRHLLEQTFKSLPFPRSNIQ